MNQKVVIYIILSAILLYLYYRRKDGAIFAAFVVMVAGTMFASASEREGFGFGGGGGGGDKECAKLGFITPKIDKKDINGSLEKVMKNFKTVVSKYIKFDGKYTEPKEEYNDALKFIQEAKIVGSEVKNLQQYKEKIDNVENFGIKTFQLIVMPYMTMPSKEGQTVIIEKLGELNKKDDKGNSQIMLFLKGGQIVLDILNKIKKSDEMKDATKDVNNILSVSICSVKQFILIWQNIQKASQGGGDKAGDKDGGDEEEKSNKKKKSTNKKKSKKDDEDAADADAEDE